MQLKTYKSIYKENYQFDSVSDDNIKKEYIKHDPSEDFGDSYVDEIQVIDIKTEDEEYFNLNKDFGGTPRISSKGNFSAFAEDNQVYIINRRSKTVNNKTVMVYTSNSKFYGLQWKDGKAIPFIIVDENNTYKILVISARKLKALQDRDKVKQLKMKGIKSLGKTKYTNGGN